jgi:hypothetical protein
MGIGAAAENSRGTGKTGQFMFNLSKFYLEKQAW